MKISAPRPLRALALGATLAACHPGLQAPQNPHDATKVADDFHKEQDEQIARHTLLRERIGWTKIQILDAITGERTKNYPYPFECERFQHVQIMNACMASQYIGQQYEGEKDKEQKMKVQLTPQEIAACTDVDGVSEDCLTATAYRSLPNTFDRYISVKINRDLATMECLKTALFYTTESYKKDPTGQARESRIRFTDFTKAQADWQSRRLKYDEAKAAHQELVNAYELLKKERADAIAYNIIYPQLKVAWQRKKAAASLEQTRYQNAYSRWFREKTLFQKKNPNAVFRDPPVQPAEFEEVTPKVPSKIPPKPTPPAPFTLEIEHEPVEPNEVLIPSCREKPMFWGREYKNPQDTISELGTPHPKLDDDRPQGLIFPEKDTRDKARDAAVAQVIMNKRLIDRLAAKSPSNAYDCARSFHLIESGRDLEGPWDEVMKPFEVGPTAVCHSSISGKLNTDCVLRMDAPKFVAGYDGLLQSVQKYQGSTIACLQH